MQMFPMKVWVTTINVIKNVLYEKANFHIAGAGNLEGLCLRHAGTLAVYIDIGPSVS
jgi:hypothetical protein